MPAAGASVGTGWRATGIAIAARCVAAPTRARAGTVLRQAGPISRIPRTRSTAQTM